MPHLHLENDYWNWKFLKLYFELKKIQVPQFEIMSAFHMWMVGYHHFKKLPIKKKLLKEFLA
jgi:hypothetical protein